MGPLGRAWFQHRHEKRKQSAAAALDTEAKLEAIDRALHPKQKLFVYDSHRRIAALVGARGGKSTGGRGRFLRRMLTTKRARCLFVAPKQHQAKKIIWEPFKEMLHRLGIAFESNESELWIRLLHNGSMLMLGGAATKADIDRYRGLAFHEIGIDEATSFRAGLLEMLIDRVLAPRLGDYRGTLWVISTPGHLQRGLFYEVTRIGSEEGTPIEEQGDEQPEGWSTHHWSLEDGAPHVKALANAWAEALETKRRNGWSDDHPVWQREYLGYWSADDTETIFKYRPHKDGEQWNQWIPKAMKANGFAELPEELKGKTVFYAYGVDPGIRDPFGVVIFAWDPHDPKQTLWQVYEFAEKGMYAERVATLFRGVDPKAGRPTPEYIAPDSIVGTTDWPAAKVADKQNNLALFEELAQVYGLYFQAAQKRDKHASQELFNGDLLAGRIKVMKGSNLELQLMTLQYVVDELGGIEEDKAARNDLADAAVYARGVASHMHTSKVPAKEPYFAPRDESPEDDTGPEPESYEESLLFDDSDSFLL